ncbi:hypothetical protein HPB51_023944 [Rhipicephalus microplus]|uniref:alanine--tRNA ligase n=1 Tax=Rhipicephalus microplus TaxID=6941 RepID=A0A9J6DD56_RHIMP|nr:hypothetical protein HPB51_023944 [Rhipicephalus microplus]
MEGPTPKTQRVHHDAAFKRKVIACAKTDVNRAASQSFGVPETCVRDWRKQKQNIVDSKDSRKGFSGPQQGRFPQIEELLGEYVIEQLRIPFVLFFWKAFDYKKPMSPAEVKATEQHAIEMISKNEVVYAKDSPLALAKAIQGLRAVFNETYPDPVRVVSIGVPITELLEDPSSPAGSLTSIEFCGGTHLKRAGHVGDFVISTEEAIAKGIRRIVALTGPEATKAVKKAEHYQSEVNKLRTEVEKVSQAAQGKDLVKQIVELTEEISQSSISYWKKDELRTDLKNLKKKLDDLDRSNKAQAQQLAIETVKKLLEDKKDCDYIVHVLEVGDNAKALDAALKQVRTLTPNAAAMFLSQDTEKGKVICLSTVPKGIVARGLTANAWVKEVSDVIGGKGGGREESAQAIGNNVGSIEKALQVANEFAKLKLAC